MHSMVGLLLITIKISVFNFVKHLEIDAVLGAQTKNREPYSTYGERFFVPRNNGMRHFWMFYLRMVPFWLNCP